MKISMKRYTALAASFWLDGNNGVHITVVFLEQKADTVLTASFDWTAVFEQSVEQHCQTINSNDGVHITGVFLEQKANTVLTASFDWTVVFEQSVEQHGQIINSNDGVHITVPEFIETWICPKQAVWRGCTLYKFGFRVDISIP